MSDECVLAYERDALLRSLYVVQYENAEQWYINLDRAIKAVNANGTITLQYSTPSLYVKARSAEPVQWPIKTDDFFPYAFSYDTPDSPNSYWTGYLSSRPTLKGYIRETSALLQVVRHFELFSGVAGSASEQLWEAQAVLQHHDAVAGTAKQAVTFDYAQRLAAGIETADNFLETAIASVVSKTGEQKSGFSRCPLVNISVCEASNGAPLVAAVVYNPAARALSSNTVQAVMARIRIPVYSSNYTVYAADGTAVPAQQIIPVMPTPAQPADAAMYEAVFPLDIAGLGIETVFLQQEDSAIQAQAAAQSTDEASPTIENLYYVLYFDSGSGLITSITNKADNSTQPFTQDFAYYNAYQGAGQKSGAYIFRPAEQYAQPLTTSSTPVTITRVIKGEYVQQVWQQVSDWVVQKISLYYDRPAIEFEWTVGPIPDDDKQGKEVIIRFNSSIASDATWYTDSNGREFQKRVRDQRPSWPLQASQPIAGNYYPVNAVQWLADAKSAMVVLNDRSQGGASIVDGSLEFMVHRRLLRDDGRGVGEPLDERGADGKGLVVTGRHYVSLLSPDVAADLAREGQNLIYNAPHISFTPASSIADYTASHHTNLSFLATDLPTNVELITAQNLGTNHTQTLIRLAHQFGVNESVSQGQSQPATVDLATLFMQSPTAVHELSLTAVHPAGTRKGYEWNTTDGRIGKRAVSGERAERRWGKDGLLLNSTITLQPLEIRTFALTFQ